MVRVKGLEPSRSCPHKNLNLARLPIPPHPHIVFAKPLELSFVIIAQNAGMCQVVFKNIGCKSEIFRFF